LIVDTPVTDEFFPEVCLINYESLSARQGASLPRLLLYLEFPYFYRLHCAIAALRYNIDNEVIFGEN